MLEGETLGGLSQAVFVDSHGHKCSIQRSAVAEENAIWLGLDKPKAKVLSSKAKALGIKTEVNQGWVDYPLPDEVLLVTHMHLSRHQVKALLPLLKRFADTGNLWSQ